MPEQWLRQAALRAGRTFPLGMPVTTECAVVTGNQMVLADQIQKSFANDIEEHSSMK